MHPLRTPIVLSFAGLAARVAFKMRLLDPAAAAVLASALTIAVQLFGGQDRIFRGCNRGAKSLLSLSPFSHTQVAISSTEE